MIGQLVVKTVAEAAGLIATEELAIPSAHTAKPIQVLQDLVVIRRDLNFSKKSVLGKRITANCVICGMDIQPNIGYTTHGDSPLFVVIPVFVVWLFTL
jgi:hypothetical protein